MSAPAEELSDRLDALEREEQRLRSDEAAAAGAAGAEQVAADATRLEEVRVELDRLWDYLRQRRALRRAGRDPDVAEMRDARTVERYLG